MTTAPQVVDVRHGLKLPAWRPPVRSWGIRAWLTLGGVLAVLLAAVVAAGGSVVSARSAILVSAGLLCLPIAVADLTSRGWGLLALGPTLLAIEWASRDAR